jgi:hypothetical protein
MNTHIEAASSRARNLAPTSFFNAEAFSAEELALRGYSQSPDGGVIATAEAASRTKECPSCHGKGGYVSNAGRHTCRSCNGLGGVYRPAYGGVKVH